MGSCGHLSTCGYPPLWQRATLIGEKTTRAEKRAGSALWGNQGKAHSTEQKDGAHRPAGSLLLSSDLESIPLTPLNLILSILDRKPYRPWWLHSDPFTIQESPSFLSHFIGPTLYVDFSISMLLRMLAHCSSSSCGQKMATAIPSTVIVNKASDPRKGVFIQYFCYYRWKSFPSVSRPSCGCNEPRCLATTTSQIEWVAGVFIFGQKCP